MNTPDSAETGALCLAGSLEIRDGESLRLAILEGLATRPGLLLDLKHIETCDAAGAQILWSACRTAALEGKPIRFENVMPPVLECWAALGMPADFFNSPASVLAKPRPLQSLINSPVS